MNKIRKGEFGYIGSQRKREIAKTIILFLLSLAIYMAGLITTGSNKNLLTIVAVLGCLPASKCAVNMIMFLKARGCTSGLRDQLLPHAEGLSQLYDCVITSYEAAFQMSHMAYRNGKLIGVTEDPKCKTGACEKHLRSMCSQNGLKGVDIGIFQDTAKYLKRLDQLRDMETGEEEEERAATALALMKAISL